MFWLVFMFKFSLLIFVSLFFIVLFGVTGCSSQSSVSPGDSDVFLSVDDHGWLFPTVESFSLESSVDCDVVAGFPVFNNRMFASCRSLVDYGPNGTKSFAMFDLDDAGRRLWLLDSSVSSGASDEGFLSWGVSPEFIVALVHVSDDVDVFELQFFDAVSGVPMLTPVVLPDVEDVPFIAGVDVSGVVVVQAGVFPDSQLIGVSASSGEVVWLLDASSFVALDTIRFVGFSADQHLAAIVSRFEDKNFFGVIRLDSAQAVVMHGRDVAVDGSSDNVLFKFDQCSSSVVDSTGSISSAVGNELLEFSGDVLSDAVGMSIFDRVFPVQGGFVEVGSDAATFFDVAGLQQWTVEFPGESPPLIAVHDGVFIVAVDAGFYSID